LSAPGHEGNFSSESFRSSITHGIVCRAGERNVQLRRTTVLQRVLFALLSFPNGLRFLPDADE
jgi:hypothetical protein